MKKLLKKLLVLLVAVVVIFGIRGIYLNSYLNWPTEKKQAYQFMLLERKLLSHPEKCGKVLVVIQKTNWENDFDTLSPTMVKELKRYPHILGVESDTLSPLEIKKLASYPSAYSVTITVPFEEFERNGRLSLKKSEGKINAWIIMPAIVNVSSGAFVFGIFPEDQVLWALKQANKIVESI